MSLSPPREDGRGGGGGGGKGAEGDQQKTRGTDKESYVACTFSERFGEKNKNSN